MSRSLLVLAALALPASAADPKDGPPIRVALVASSAAQEIEADDAKAYAKQVHDGVAAKSPPPASKTRFSLEITNATDKPIEVWVSGDPVKLMLTVDGPGAVVAEVKTAFSKEVRAPKAVKIAAGKSHTIAFESLAFGFRNESHRAWLTETGRYELGGTFETAVSPAPPGSVAAGKDGFGKIKVNVEPGEVKVRRRG